MATKILRIRFSFIALLVLGVLCLPHLVLAGWPSSPTQNVPLCTAQRYQDLPNITSDGKGGAIVVWEDWRNGNDWDIYVRRVDSNGNPMWTADGVAICTASGDQRVPTIVGDGRSGAIIAWSDKRNGTNFDIYVQRIDSTGVVQWTPNGEKVCTASGDQGLPTIASDGYGGAIITWEDYRGGSTNSDIYAQRVDLNGTMQWATDGVAICSATNFQQFPIIISDGSGGAIITWQDYRGGNWDIYAQLVDGSGVVQWTANGVAICTDAYAQDRPNLTADGSGGAIINWQDKRSGDWDIYAQLVNASGVVQWTADGVEICGAVNDQEWPRITDDGSGGAIITWQDYRSGNWDVYAQRVNGAGAVQWTADGVAVCAASGDQMYTRDQQYPKIVSYDGEDGEGGAIITWEDSRDLGTTSWDIYAQRINGAGIVKWTANGVAICTQVSLQLLPVITTDGGGGAIIAWRDKRVCNNDIYCQRVHDGELPVTLYSFTAKESDGKVTLRWITQSEVDNLGFHIYRSITKDGNYERITTELIRGAGNSSSKNNYSFTDLTVTKGATYWYKIEDVAFDGSSQMHGPISVKIQQVASLIKSMPGRFALLQNRPNPFNPSTVISYDLPKATDLTLTVYSLSGQKVVTLVSGYQEAGHYEVTWDSRDATGQIVASGIYLYRLEAPSQGFVESRRMILVR